LMREMSSAGGPFRWSLGGPCAMPMDGSRNMFYLMWKILKFFEKKIRSPIRGC
jgi:hypothetical protein